MIYLASGSPRRAELLHQINVNFRLLTVQIDETPLLQEIPADYVRRMARSKALAGQKLLPADESDTAVLAADTIITIDDKIIGKPADRTDCKRILSHLSGREHQVMSCVSLALKGEVKSRTSVSSVWFKSLSDSEIDCYCKTREPMDKAGAYAVQGRAAIFIRQLQGSYSSVMGLPLYETAELLNEAGITV